MTLAQQPHKRARTKPVAASPAAPVDCRIGADVDKVVEASGQLKTALRRLRKDVENCKNCSEGVNCPSLAAYLATVRQAVNEVGREWRQ
jgi:hypothetical protein